MKKRMVPTMKSGNQREFVAEWDAQNCKLDLQDDEHVRCMWDMSSVQTADDSIADRLAAGLSDCNVVVEHNAAAAAFVLTLRIQSNSHLPH